MAALMAVVLATFAVATRFRDYVPSVSTAALGNETSDRLLVGVLNFEGMGVNYATTIGYECLARMTGRKLVLVPLVTEHFDNVPIDLAEIFHIEGGALMPLQEAPDGIMDSVWASYGDPGTGTNGWVQGGAFNTSTFYFRKVESEAQAYRTELPCRTGSIPCIESVVRRVEEKSDDEIVTVFSDAKFCLLDEADVIRGTLSPPDSILDAWAYAFSGCPSGCGLSTLHWRRGDRCTKKQISRDRERREFPCSDPYETIVPELCKSHAPLYVATDDFDDDFQAALLEAGCFTFPQVFGDVGVTDAFGSFMLDITTMAKRTEKKFFVLGASTDNLMLDDFMRAAGLNPEVIEITADGMTPVNRCPSNGKPIFTGSPLHAQISGTTCDDSSARREAAGLESDVSFPRGDDASAYFRE